MKNKIIFTTTICLIVLLCTSIALQLDTFSPTTQKLPHLDIVNVVGRHSDGTVFYNETTHNLLTTLGSSYMISMIANATISTKAVYMVLSTDATPLVSWAKLSSEQGSGAALQKTAALTPTYGTCTTTSGTSTYMLVTNTWTANGTATGIVAMGLCYTASANASDLFAVAAITSASVISGDTLQGTWNVTAPCG